VAPDLVRRLLGGLLHLGRDPAHDLVGACEIPFPRPDPEPQGDVGAIIVVVGQLHVTSHAAPRLDRAPDEVEVLLQPERRVPILPGPGVVRLAEEAVTFPKEPTVPVQVQDAVLYGPDLEGPALGNVVEVEPRQDGGRQRHGPVFVCRGRQQLPCLAWLHG
jgi:hypothetical protein